MNLNKLIDFAELFSYLPQNTQKDLRALISSPTSFEHLDPKNIELIERYLAGYNTTLDSCIQEYKLWRNDGQEYAWEDLDGDDFESYDMD